MKTSNQESKSAVLNAFTVEKNLNADTLSLYLKRYPQFRESLIDLSIELLTTPSFDKVPNEAAHSEDTNKAWSKFQSMLSPQDPASVVVSTIENPLSRLNKQDFRELATQLNISRLLLSQFRDNVILVATIPQKFLWLLADRLHISVEKLCQALDTPPTIASVKSFKASDKPNVCKKMTFDEALENSGLNEQQLAALKDMKD